jgi:hypothetical protein
MKLLFKSLQVLVVLWTTLPYGACVPYVNAGPSAPMRYLFRLILRAVLPVPNTSNAAPILGVTSFQLEFGVSGNVKLRAGANCTGPNVSSGKLLLTASNRTPPFTVSRLTVHLSCAYKPSSWSRVQVLWYGVA